MARDMLQAENNMLHPAEPTAEEKLEQLNRILHSREFQGSESLTSLLRYLVQDAIANPNVAVKEYTIAVEVFGRSTDFDPRTDSVVRVQSKRLRSKLHEYYETEGRGEKVLIDVPKGHYKVAFSYLQNNGASPAHREKGQRSAAISNESVSARDARTASWKIILITALTSVLLTLASLFVLNVSFRTKTGDSVARSVDAFGPVWAPFLKNNASSLIVVSNPPVYRFLNDSDPDARLQDSVEITPQQLQRLSDILKNKLVIKQSRPPRLVLSTGDYTGMGEAIGLYHLSNLFSSAGKSVTLKQSRTVSAEDLKNHDVILLGSTWVNEWVEKLPVKEDFTYSVNATIIDSRMQPGEQREYGPKYNATGGVQEDYALITIKPGVTDEHSLMILSGILSEGTQAAAEYVTRPEYLNSLNQRLKQMSGEEGHPKYYQVLLKVDVDNGIPTTVSVLAIHQLEVSRS
jgi:hypothetical protein